MNCPGCLEVWQEITTGWADSSSVAVAALQGVPGQTPYKKKRKLSAVNYSESSGDVVAQIVLTAVIFLGHPLFYHILQLEAFKSTCAGPAKELDSKDFLVVHRLECIYTKSPTLSPSFFVERIQFKVSFLTLHTKTPDPDADNNFLNTPPFTFPVYAKPAVDEPRELPASKKQGIIDSALTIPRWAHQQQLCSRQIDKNFLS